MCIFVVGVFSIGISGVFGGRVSGMSVKKCLK